MKLFLTLLILVAVTSTATADAACPAGRNYFEFADKANRDVELVPFSSIIKVEWDRKYPGGGRAYLKYYGFPPTYTGVRITTPQIKCYKKWLDSRSRRQGY